MAAGGGADRRGSAARDDGRPCLARGRRASAREAPPRLPRRPGRPLPRPGRMPAGRARLGRGRRDDGRRPLDAQPAALGLTWSERLSTDVTGARSSARTPRATTQLARGIRSASTTSSSSAAACGRARPCSRSAPARGRRHAGSSSSAPTRSSRSSPTPALAEFLAHATADAWTIVGSPLEEADLETGAFDLATAASSFHWVDEPVGLAKIDRVAPPGRLVGDVVDAVRRAGAQGRLHGRRRPSLRRSSEEPGGRQRLRTTVVRARCLRAPRCPGAGGLPERQPRADHLAVLVGHRRDPWALSTFSPIRSLDEKRREALLDEVARVAEHEFGGRVERTLTTSLYTARKPF